MSWQDRVQQGIVLVSPGGEQFIALWQGDRRSVNKKLGIFDYPFYQGSMVQDLDVNADLYPLSFNFEGADHDLEAERFFEACKLRGVWTINHPTKGVKTLQLVSVTEEIQPVDNCNITVFNSEWIEPLGQFATVSIAQLGAAVKASAAVVIVKAQEQFTSGIKLKKPSALAQFKASIAKITAGIKAVLDPLTQTVAEVNAAVDGVYRGITAALQTSTLSVVALAGQIQNLISLPGQILGDLSTRIDCYTKLITDVTGLTHRDGNSLVTTELVATVALANIASVIVDSQLTTREDALALIETAAVTLTSVTDALDNGQSQFADIELEIRYYSQSDAYTDTVLLTAQLMNFLLRQAFDLAVAKRFTLKTNRCPVEIALTEGIDLDLFISSNNLKGDDILLLTAGREVVVYL